MVTQGPPTVAVEHWTAFRVASSTVIERWSVDHEGRTVRTFESEIEARAFCRRSGWSVAATVELGRIGMVIQPEPAP